MRSLAFVLLWACQHSSRHSMLPRKIHELLIHCKLHRQVFRCWPWLWLGLVLDVGVNLLSNYCLGCWAFLGLMLDLAALRSRYLSQVLMRFLHYTWCPFLLYECFLWILERSFLWKPWCPWFSWQSSACVPWEYPSSRCAGLGSPGSSLGPPRRGR